MRVTKTSAIAIGLLAGSAVGVAAQDEEAAAEPSTPAKVTGTIDSEAADLVQEPTETVVDGVLEVRGAISDGYRFEMDDGTGAYEGHSALLYAHGDPSRGGTLEVEGFVFPGVLPEYPDSVEAPTQ